MPPLSNAIPSPLLAIDIGNSRVKFGLFDSATLSQPGALPVCRDFLAAAITEPFPWKILAAWAPSESATCRAIVAGVNPTALTGLLASWPQISWPLPRVIDDWRSLPLTVRVAAPEKVGIDRLLNAVAGNSLRPAGRPLIIVSSGTATTVDWIAPDGAFEGGAILPGLDLGGRALHQHTALLPPVTTSDLVDAPPSALGRTTLDALRSGLYWGHVGAVRELIAQLGQQAADPPLVLLTGGGAEMLVPHLPSETRHLPHAPLYALALIAQ